jgi:hypothetical protein
VTEHVDFDAVIGYWLGELPPTAEVSIEEHFFGCAQCTRLFEQIVAFGAGVRATVQRGKLGLIVSAQFVEAMQRAGLRLREYRLGPGGSVNCTIRLDEDAVVSRMRASLAGVKRIDVVHRRTVGGVEEPEVRLEDVPFDPASGEILLIPPAAALKAMPSHTIRTRLIAVGEGGEVPLGDYTFLHSSQ